MRQKNICLHYASPGAREWQATQPAELVQIFQSHLESALRLNPKLTTFDFIYAPNAVWRARLDQAGRNSMGLEQVNIIVISSVETGFGSTENGASLPGSNTTISFRSSLAGWIIKTILAIITWFFGDS